VGAGGSTGGVAGGAAYLDCVTPSQWKCTNYTTGAGCLCDPSLPKSPADCATPYDFTCDAEFYSPTSEPIPTGCSCQPSSLVPSDCSRPEEFTCSHSGDYFTGCTCNTNAPLSADDCAPDYCTMFTCQSETPRYGCYCENLGCIK